MKAKKLNDFLYILFAGFILMIPALYNGYPLVYPDTGTYIKSGMELMVPLDRPIMYGLFIRIVSLKTSLWPVIALQCLVLSYVMALCYKILSDSKNLGNAFVFIIAILTAFTGIGWYAGQLMPDIFTAIAVMCGLLLLLYKKLTRPQCILVAVILVFAECVHFSNFAICFLVFIFLFGLVKTKLLPNVLLKEIRFAVFFAALFSGIIVSSLVNYSIASSFKINQGSHVFLIGRMIDNGLLEKFLNEKCKETNYILCDCKDQLPVNSRAFLWDGESPLFKHGGWTATSYQYNQVLRAMFSNPKYLLLFIYRGMTSGFSQLFQNEIGSGLTGSYNDDINSPAASQVAIHFKQESNPYHQSRQNTNLWDQSLDFSLINSIYYLLLIITVLFLLFTRLTTKVWTEINGYSKLLFVVVIAGIVANAFITAGLANIYDRLQGRVSWMFVFIALMLVVNERTIFKKWIFEKLKENRTTGFKI